MCKHHIKSFGALAFGAKHWAHAMAKDDKTPDDYFNVSKSDRKRYDKQALERIIANLMIQGCKYPSLRQWLLNQQLTREVGGDGIFHSISGDGMEADLVTFAMAVGLRGWTWGLRRADALFDHMEVAHSSKWGWSQECGGGRAVQARPRDVGTALDSAFKRCNGGKPGSGGGGLGEEEYIVNGFPIVVNLLCLVLVDSLLKCILSGHHHHRFGNVTNAATC